MSAGDRDRKGDRVASSRRHRPGLRDIASANAPLSAGATAGERERRGRPASAALPTAAAAAAVASAADSCRRVSGVGGPLQFGRGLPHRGGRGIEADRFLREHERTRSG